ncbi:hypothetical protein [Candidatus Magnetaquicoccus inordinatus]|uniref:hypothetical protein n=1 Tax=Candidatus Magnetaquicoccus inordinatus TaxID=2496818 RepID=UPI00187D216D|nr:hypothetical protein [Candidatus Magnetaquicoccus inordinatus]
MARRLDEVIAGLPLRQQQEIEEQAARFIAEEKTLRDVRQAHALAQERMAAVLHN